MATDRELAAQSMMQAGIGSLGGRPDTTYRDKMNQAITNLQATQMGDWEGRRTSDDIRKDAIKWGRKAGLPNRISFAGEGGRDILNPNEMRVNAPSYGDWKSMAKRKMIMDRRYQGEDNPYYPQDLLAKIYTSDMPGMINEGSNWNFMPGGDPLWDEVSPQGEAINQILQDPSLQKIIQGLIKSGETDPNVFRQYIRPDILEQLPPGAFTTIDDFINQQPITVI